MTPRDDQNDLPGSADADAETTPLPAEHTMPAASTDSARLDVAQSDVGRPAVAPPPVGGMPQAAAPSDPTASFPTAAPAAAPAPAPAPAGFFSRTAGKVTLGAAAGLVVFALGGGAGWAVAEATDDSHGGYSSGSDDEGMRGGHGGRHGSEQGRGGTGSDRDGSGTRSDGNGEPRGTSPTAPAQPGAPSEGTTPQQSPTPSASSPAS